MTANNKIEEFLKYLSLRGVSQKSLKYYKSDIVNFLHFSKDRKIDRSLVTEYIETEKLTTPLSTLNRRLSTLRSYSSFIDHNFMEGVENVSSYKKIIKSWQDRILSKFETKPKIKNALFKLFFTRPNWYKKYHSYPLATYIHIAILILFTSVSGYAFYDQVFYSADRSLAFPTALTRPNRFLSFQGRLTSNVGNPITSATNVVFKLYDASSGGTNLWDSGTCSITPDQDGIFSTLLGSSCGAEIASSVFSENAAVWVGVTVGADAEATPRIQIATVAYALNSETLQGFPAGTGTSTIPYINSAGTLVLANASPKLQSTSGTFAVEGLAMTISTPNASDGVVTINPDGVGTLDLTFEGAAPGLSANGFVNATNANITSGSLYSGTVASNASGYNFINFLSGSSPTSKFSVDSTGLTTVGADLYVSSGISLYNNAVTDDTIEAGKFCTGDGETNCVTDFSTFATGTNYWTRTAGNISPLTLNDTISATTSAAVALTLTQTGAFNALLVQDVAGDATPFVIDQSGNVGIGDSTPESLLNVATDTAGQGIRFSRTDGTWDSLIETDGFGGIHLRHATTGTTMGNGIYLANTTGRVGIGTTAPARNLVVYSSADIPHFQLASATSGVTNTDGFQIRTISNETYLTNFESTKMYLGNGGTQDLTIDASGNVGIGDTSPGAPLDVVGDVYISDGLSLFETAVSDGTVEATKFCTGDGETNCITDFSSIVTGSSYWTRSAGNISPLTLNDTISATTSASVALTLTQTGAFNALLVQDVAGDTTPFVIDQDGNMGIGDSAPALKLEVAGTQGYPATTGTAQTGVSRIRGTTNNNVLDIGLGSATPWGAWFQATDQSNLSLEYPLLFNPNGGNVGIGTTTPTASLDVAGDASVSGHLVMRGSGTNYIHTLNGSNFGISTSVGGDTGLSEKLTVLNSGNVGIGTTGPAELLSISGTGTNLLSITRTGTSFNVPIKLTNDTNSVYFGMNSNEDFAVGTTADLVTNGQFVVQRSTGYVGIGDMSPAAPLDVVGDAYISDGLSLYETAVSNGTVEATQFCTGDGETNCIADFSSIVTGSSYWTRSAGNISPLTLNDTISATTSAAIALTLTQTGAFDAFLVQDSAGDTTPFVIDQDGNVMTGGVLQVGGATHSTYSRFGTGTTAHSGNLSTSADVLLEDLEIDGTLFLDGGIIANVAGTTAISLSATPTTTSNTLSSGNWMVDNTANVGLAALIVNNTKAGDLFTASASGATKFVITNTGNVGVGTNIPTGKFDILDTSNSLASFILTNNTATTIGAGANTLGVIDLQSTSLTTGNFMNIELNALTSGKGINLSSTSTTLSTGNLMAIDWTPGSATTATGDLFSLNIGANGNIGNLFNIKDSGNSLFSVSETVMTSNLPASFTAAGDVSIAYDLVFTNPTSSYVKSAAPLYIQAGETFNSSNLTLQTYNSGNILLDPATGGVGIGTGITPVGKFDVNGKKTGKALAIFNETGNQDIFTASASGTTRISITNAGNILPGTDNTQSLGSSPSARFKDLFLGPASLHIQSKSTDAGYPTLGLDYSIGINTAGSLVTSLNNTSVMTITQGGNVILGSNAKLADSYVTAGISLGDATSTALSGFGATSIVGALNELKTTNKNISHNDYLSWANHYNAKAEGSSVSTNETLNGLFFDTFDDSTKFDGTNSTSSGVIKISDNNSRVGITGGQTYNTATNDNDGQAYLGSNTVNDIYYYDRTRDSSPDVQVELGIDPNWYNGVTLSVATSSASYSQNGTLADKNPNLTTSYNGGLIKVTGTDSTPRTIFITIKSPTTFDWTNYQGDAATGVTITPGTAQALGATGVSATFTATNYNVGDVFKIASWYIEAEGTTRGAKQQFPERSILTSTNDGLDIIDTDTQKLWMRFVKGSSYHVNNLTSFSGVSALNGSMFIGSDTGGLRGIKFDTDSGTTHNTSGRYLFNQISVRNTPNLLTIIDSSQSIVSNTANDVAAAVIPNQTTKEVTVSGWGYKVGDSVLNYVSEQIALPYKFNSTPNITVTSMGSKSTTSPSNLSECTASTIYTGTSGTTTNSTTYAVITTINGTAIANTTYVCYTWTATGTVSPKQFVAVATGASSADGGISIINETDGSVANVSIGSAYPNPTWFTKTAIAGNSLYTAGNYSTENITFLPVYYGIHGMQSESSFGLYRSGFYHVQNNSSGWSATGPIILGTAAGFNQITSLSATENTSTNDPTANTIYVGTTTGLSVIQEKQGHSNYADGLVESGGSVKYYTKDYISEEMVGGVRGMWPLSANGALSMSDASIKANTLTNNGTATAITSVRGAGVSLNGTTQYLSCTDAACGGTTKLDTITSSQSIGAWVKTSSATGSIIAKYNASVSGSYAIYLSGGAVNYYLNTSASTTITSNRTVNDGNWHYIVATYDGAYVYIYIDGQLDKSTAYTGTIIDSTAIFQIGARQSSSANTDFFTGSIDEPFVTANTLTAGQVKNMYQVGYRALQSHASSGLGTAAADTNQQLGFISTGTSSIGSVAPDFNNQYMYVGTNSTTLGAVSKIQLNSDTNIKTYNSSANVPAGGTLLIDEDATSISVGYNLQAVGSAASGVKSMAPDNNANALTGSLFSKTQTLSSSTKFAYLWTSFVTDASDATSAINIYACNAYATKALCDSNSAWVLGTIVQTDSNQSPPEREYNFSFPTAGSSLTFKINFSRGSTKTNTYIERYGATWSSSVGGADLAERYKSSEAVFPGDIVSLTEAPVQGEALVSLSRSENDKKVIGIVTTNPGIVMDDSLVDLNFNASTRNSPDRPAVALSGRVPLKVSTKNGSILVGDAITTSDIPGVGVKAIKAGNVVAKAIESFSCEEGVDVCEGKIMAFVNVTWFDPDVYLTEAGDIKIKGYETLSADGTKTNIVYKIVRIAVNGVEEIIDRIGVFGAITTGRLEAGIISPVANSDLIIDLDPDNASQSSRLVIKGEDDKEVASIDATGKITSEELIINNDATISGTLYADVIESERLDEIEALLAEVEGNQALFAEAINWSTDTATESATISDVIASNLFVTGNATVTSLFVTENLTAKSLDSIEGTLSLQSLAIAPIEIMAGKIKIDTNGDAVFSGNVTIAGNLELGGNFVVAESVDPAATMSATIIEGQINSNSTAGKAVLVANTTELKIINPKVKLDSLIYVTPVSSTENKVLYVKSKDTGEFVIGFNEPITTDVEFNWWIIELKPTEIINE
jgi:cytoskeletal protein CcmA (bactofilin family)